MEALKYETIKNGVTGSTVRELIGAGRLRRSDVQMVIPARTLERRLSGDQVLKINEADAIARLVRIRDHALRVFEREDVSEEWLSLPNPALGGEVPIEMASTDIGGREVEAVLGRIEHGVYG